MATAKRSAAAFFQGGATRGSWAVRSILGCAAAIVLAGCGGGLPVVPVTGVVKLDGAPVADAGVGFYPEKGPGVSGRTNKEGKFTLETANLAGALVGKYRVSVNKVKFSGVGPDEQPQPGGLKTEYLVPQKYSDPSTSGLTAEVGAGKNDFVFELSSKP